MSTLNWKAPTSGSDEETTAARKAARQLRGDADDAPRKPKAVERLADRPRCEYTVEYDDEEYQCGAVLRSALAKGLDENICYAHYEQWLSEQDE